MRERKREKVSERKKKKREGKKGGGVLQGNGKHTAFLDTVVEPSSARRPLIKK